MFSVTSTSKSAGRRMRCMAAASTSMCSSATSGNSARTISVATSRHRREVSSTFALSMEVSAPAARARQLRRHAHDALDLGAAVDAQVGRVRRVAVLLAEVDPAGQLAHEHEVDAGDHLGLERSRPRRAPGARAPGAGWRRRRAPRAAAAGPVRGAPAACGCDHFGPPMAPSSTASALRQALRVRSGSGSPVASMAAPPKGSSSSANSCPCRLRERPQALARPRR